MAVSLWPVRADTADLSGSVICAFSLEGHQTAPSPLRASAPGRKCALWHHTRSMFSRNKKRKRN